MTLGESQSYFDGHGRSSPPTASGGAYYPPYPATPNAGPSSGGYAPYPNSSTPTDQPYVPQDYTGYAPPPPPNTTQPPLGPGPSGRYPAPPPGPPSGLHPGGNYPPDHVSDPPRGGVSTDGASLRTELDSICSVAASDFIIDPVMSETEETGAPRRRLRSKSVSFIPLSPKSSKTMERHRQEHIAASNLETNEGGGGGGGDMAEGSAQERANISYRDDHKHQHSDKYRHSADLSSDRAPVRSSRRASAPQDDIEVLPDRFDEHGQPLDVRPTPDLTMRSGEFVRSPRREGDWGVQGSWQVGGTDPEAVERMVNGVVTVLEGRQGFFRSIGDMFTGGADLLGDGRSTVGGENRGRYRRR